MSLGVRKFISRWRQALVASDERLSAFERETKCIIAWSSKRRLHHTDGALGNVDSLIVRYSLCFETILALKMVQNCITGLLNCN